MLSPYYVLVALFGLTILTGFVTLVGVWTDHNGLFEVGSQLFRTGFTATIGALTTFRPQRTSAPRADRGA
jgi:hypothetical protein